jgi:hypothetical protein
MIALTLFILWWATGIASFIFWWTHDYDLEVADFIFALSFGGMAGRIEFVIGWFIHGNKGSIRRVILKRRRVI